MASLNPLTRELVFKIVFYGPGLGGKTSTLQYIFDATKPEHRGKMVSLATPTDRTLYFDFLPLRMPRIRGMSVRLQLFTVPGQMYFAATRKLVLAGADGVVFVADSLTARADANRESLDDLRANLREHGRELGEIPHTLLYNKRDLDETMPVEDMDRALNLYGAPSRGTVATKGAGVFAGLEEITRRVLRAYEAELPRSSGTPSSSSGDVGLEDAIRGLTERVAIQTPPGGTPRVSSVPPISSERVSVPPRAPAMSEIPATSASNAEAEQRLAEEAPTSVDMKPLAEAALSEARAAADAPDGGTGAAPPTRPPPDSVPPPSSTPLATSLRGPVPSPHPHAMPHAFAPFTLGALWPDTERAAVRDAESRLADGETSSAVLASEKLLLRTLARLAASLGREAPPDPAEVVLLLGLDGPRYVTFRALARRARSGERVGDVAACEALLFAAEAQRLASSASAASVRR